MCDTKSQTVTCGSVADDWLISDLIEARFVDRQTVDRLRVEAEKAGKGLLTFMLEQKVI